MDTEPQVGTTSLLARQPSGIRALPSHDDDVDSDTDPYLETNNSPEKLIENYENGKNLSSASTTSMSNSCSSSLSSGGRGGGKNNGGFVSGEEDFETPMAGPDEETLQKSMVFDESDVPAAGAVRGSSGFDSRNVSVPIAKVSGEEDDDENEVFGGEDGGESGDEVVGGSYVGEGAPKVRVSGEEDAPNLVDEEVDSLGEKGAAEHDGGASVVENDLLGSGTDENASVGPTVVESGRGVEFTDKGDAVVDSIDVDVGEAVRSGTVVVGVKESEESQVKLAGETSVIEGSMNSDSETVETEAVKLINEDSLAELGNEKTSVVEGSDGVKITDEGDSVVYSIHVNFTEAVRSGAAVVGEVEEMKESEYTVAEMENSVVQEPASQVVEGSIAKAPAPVSSGSIETENTKLAGEEGSMVDGINVDVVEAVRSRVAVVGDSGVERMETEVKDVGALVRENMMTLGNGFEPLVDSNASEVVDVSGEHPNEALASEAETDLESKQHEPADGVQVVSGGEGEKVQPDHVDNKPHAKSAVLGGETKSDRLYANSLLDGLDGAASDKTHLHEVAEETRTQGPEMGVEAENGEYVRQEEGDVGDSDTDEESETVFFGGTGGGTGGIVEELERTSLAASSRDFPEGMDGQIVTDTEEEGDSDEEGEGKELFDSAALAALLKAATSAGGSDSGTITITSQDGSRLFSVERPAGLGPTLRSVRPASRPSNASVSTPPSLAAPAEENLSEEEKKKLELVHQLRVKFLRLVYRLGNTTEDSLAAQVLYRLALLAGRPTSPAFGLENAKQTAMQLEAEGKDDLDFSLNILVLGKTGVGKSATINSIFGEEKVKINAFEPETTFVHEVCGIVDGVKIRVLDAPGLKSSGMEQGFNRKVLASVKKFTKKYPPDIMLYVDRLDSQTRDLNDLPMLRTITSSLGASIWRSAIVALTHASCAPPDGPSGSPLSYEVFVAQRSHIVQQSIGQAVGDLRLMNPSLMNPVSLVENHPACRKNREGQKVLPNGQTWKPQLLLLCYALKILSEASSTTKPQDPFDHRKLFGFRVRSPPLPYLLSSLLQPRAHPKLSADQGGDNVDSDVDLDDLSDSDQEEEEDEYDQLPPFKPLRKSQIAKLSRDQRKAYFEEYDYRVKLLQRKQWREELKRMREMKKKGKSGSGMDEYGEMGEDFEGENGAPATVPVPMPDMVLPPSFDSDNPAYRYRFLEPTSQFLARPVLDTHGWDHDCGYDGVNVEQNLGILGRFPAAVAVQVTKDKKEFNIHLDSAISAKHGENGSSLAGFDIQTIGKQLAYIVRGESKFKNLKKNKTAGGVAITFLGENVATGVKLEDQITLGKRVVLVGSTGTVRSQKDAAYGANFEVRLRESDYPIGQDQSSFVLSLMKWRGDLAIGGNLQTQISVGRSSKVAVRVALNNKLTGQITVKTSSSDHLQFALAGLIPIALSIYRNLRPTTCVGENYPLY